MMLVLLCLCAAMGGGEEWRRIRESDELCCVVFFGLGSRGVSLSYIIVKCDTLFACKVEELS